MPILYFRGKLVYSADSKPLVGHLHCCGGFAAATLHVVYNIPPGGQQTLSIINYAALNNCVHVHVKYINFLDKNVLNNYQLLHVYSKLYL